MALNGFDFGTELLQCPICGGGLEYKNGCLSCAARHTFDIAKQGYVNMNLHPPKSGDEKTMAAARTDFLSRGYYAEFRDALCGIIKPRGGTLVDAGCGEGYYTNEFANFCENTVGVDLSKSAISTAARSIANRPAGNIPSKIFYAVAGVNKIPIKDNCADIVTNIFAPCAEDEFSRVLKRGGIFILAGAGRKHLSGLKAKLYGEVRDNDTRRDLPQRMKLLEKQNVNYKISIDDKDAIWALFTMTPYYYKTSAADAEKLKAESVIETELDFDIYIYENNG